VCPFLNVIDPIGEAFIYSFEALMVYLFSSTKRRGFTGFLLVVAVVVGAWTVGDSSGISSPVAPPEEPVAERSSPPSVSLTEWEVPWGNTRPRDPHVAPDGIVWFVGQVGDYVGRFDPETEEFRKFDLDSGVGPHSVVVGPDGYIWYTGNRSSYLGRLDPETGDIEKIMMPRDDARDPHTHRFNAEGDMWMTFQWSEYIGFMDLPSHEVQLIEVPIEGSRPYGIDIDSDGRPWIALLGMNKLGTVDPETREFSTVDIPWEGAAPRRVAVGSDDRVYFADYGASRIGIYDPANQEFESWVTPSGDNSAPYGMTIDHENRVYVVETDPQPNRFIGFDPATEEFFFNEGIPSGGQTVRHMRYDEARQSVWFGADTNTIGRAKISE
jgi:virginiamycin B lyase